MIILLLHLFNGVGVPTQSTKADSPADIKLVREREVPEGKEAEMKRNWKTENWTFGGEGAGLCKKSDAPSDGKLPAVAAAAHLLP